jgi:hypothetical protein
MRRRLAIDDMVRAGGVPLEDVEAAVALEDAEGRLATAIARSRSRSGSRMESSTFLPRGSRSRSLIAAVPAAYSTVGPSGAVIGAPAVTSNLIYFRFYYRDQDLASHRGNPFFTLNVLKDQLESKEAAVRAKVEADLFQQLRSFYPEGPASRSIEWSAADLAAVPAYNMPLSLGDMGVQAFGRYWRKPGSEPLLFIRPGKDGLGIECSRTLSSLLSNIFAQGDDRWDPALASAYKVTATAKNNYHFVLALKNAAARPLALALTRIASEFAFAIDVMFHTSTPNFRPPFPEPLPRPGEVDVGGFYPSMPGPSDMIATYDYRNYIKSFGSVLITRVLSIWIFTRDYPPEDAFWKPCTSCPVSSSQVSGPSQQWFFRHNLFVCLLDAGLHDSHS